MSNKSKHEKTKITKISAKHTPAQSEKSQKSPANKHQVATEKHKSATSKKHKITTEKPLKQVFILARPFVAIGRYLRDSWREIRQVRWPNRKLTWKMTFAVLIYCAIFIIFIVLLDTLFTFIFNLLINAK